jgi:hypothetical protein
VDVLAIELDERIQINKCGSRSANFHPLYVQYLTTETQQCQTLFIALFAARKLAIINFVLNRVLQHTPINIVLVEENRKVYVWFATIYVQVLAENFAQAFAVDHIIKL